MSRIRKIDPQVKYYPPRLMEQLEYIKSFPLTLLEAPSGFGKTTILEHFLNECLPQTAVKMRYEFVGGHARNGWRELCRMLSKVDKVCSDRLLSLGPPSDDTLPEMIRALQELELSNDIYLWLDDFMNWDMEYPGLFLEAFSRHGKENFHIIISTQPLSGERWGNVFWNGNVWHLKEDSFVFQSEDIDSYFRTAGLPLTRSQVEEARRLTEGWIMALSLQLTSFVISGGFRQGSMDELLEAVFWRQLTPREQRFLLEISIFPRFTLEQATGFSGWSPEETEKMLMDRRFFIHYDPDSRCFYLHTQLRRLLEGYFDRLGEDRQREIYLQGGELAEKAKDRLCTLRFYYASGVWERIYAMLLTSYEVADISDEYTRPMILDLLENAPHDLKCTYPGALIPLAFSLFFLGENEKLLSMQEEIGDCIRESDLTQKEKDALLGEMELLLSFLEYNRIDAMSARHRRALKLLGGPARLISVKSTWTFGSPSVLYMFWRESGRLDEELDQMDACMPYYYRLTDGHGSGAEFIMRAEACFQRGELDEAEKLSHRALLSADLKRQNSICQCALFLLCRIAIWRGDMLLLEENRLALRERARQNTEDLCRSTLDLAEGFLCMLLNKWNEIPVWLAEGKIDQNRLVIMTQPFAYMIYGRLLLEQKDYHKLLGIGEHLLGLSSIFPNLLPQVYAHLYIGQALDALGRRPEGTASIREALAIAAPDRIYMPFAENYPGIRSLLPVSEGTEHHAEIVRIHDIRVQAERNGEVQFTPRERDILRYLKQNLTNNEIAQKLYLSPYTVRNTVSAMLKKKGLASRQQLRELPEEK